MKSSFIFTAFILCCISLFSHENPDTSNTTKKVRYTIGLSINPFGIHSKNIYSSNINQNKVTKLNLYNSPYGKSIGLNSSIVIPLSKNIVTELGLTYLFGSKTKYEDSYYISGVNITQTIKGNSIANTCMLSPKIVFRMNENKKNGYLYNKIGYQIGFSKVTSFETLVYTNEFKQANEVDLIWKMTGKPVHGFVYNLGYTFKKIEDTDTRTFIELEISNTYMKPKQTKLISIQNSTVENQTVNYSTINYKEEIEENPVYDPNKPRERLAFPLNLTYIGIKIGLLF